MAISKSLADVLHGLIDNTRWHEESELLNAHAVVADSTEVPSPAAEEESADE